MNQEEYSKLSEQQISSILDDGGRFVVYTYTISLIVITLKRRSNVFLLRKDEWAIKHGFPYLLISLLLGWWGVPWGPIYTIQSIYYSVLGNDVTADIIYDYLMTKE